MPEICRWDNGNINIDMYSFDNKKHKKPHIHVFYKDEAEYVYGLDGEVIEKEGNIPKKQRIEILNWINIRQTELRREWNNAINGLEINKIDPL